MPEWLQKILTKKRERLFSIELPSSQVLEAPAARNIAPRSTYFQITLAEMHLELEREYMRKFIPMGLAATDFLYAGEESSRPFCVSSKLVNGNQAKQPEDYIELNNTPIVGPVPYEGGNVALFIGLARLQVSSLAKAFCELLETAASTFAIVGAAHYVEVGQALLNAIGTFLGNDETELQFGFREVFDAPGNRGNPLREGYWLFTNYKGDLPGKENLRVKNGRLHLDPACSTRATGFDYCLVRIDAIEARSDYSKLPFFKTWQQIEQLLVEGTYRRAETKRIEMLQQILASPDLTDSHKEGLMAAFTRRYVEMADRYRAIAEGNRGGDTSLNQTGMDQLRSNWAGGGFSQPLVGKLKTVETFSDLPANGNVAPSGSGKDEDPVWLQEAIVRVTQNKVYDGRDVQGLADLLAAPLDYTSK